MKIETLHSENPEVKLGLMYSEFNSCFPARLFFLCFHFLVSAIVHKQLKMPFHSLQFLFFYLVYAVLNLEWEQHLCGNDSSGFDTAPDYFIDWDFYYFYFFASFVITKDTFCLKG